MSTGKTISIIVGLVIVAAVGWWLAGPLFYDTEVNEALPEVLDSDAITIRQGTFTGQDDFHEGAGGARIIEADGKKYVRFDEDFSVTNGPDLFVHFGNDGSYDASANLGRLKGSVGSQNYEIPSDIDPSQYNEIWIWCRAFSVPFASARLQ